VKGEMHNLYATDEMSLFVSH